MNSSSPIRLLSFTILVEVLISLAQENLDQRYLSNNDSSFHGTENQATDTESSNVISCLSLTLQMDPNI